MTGRTDRWARLRAAVGDIAIPGVTGDEIATTIENALNQIGRGR